MDKPFELYDVELEVTEINGNCTCSMNLGDKVAFKGGKFSLPTNRDFCL